MAAAQEQDREDRVRFEKWSKKLFAQMSVDRQRISKLISHQSSRIDRFDEFIIETRAWQREALARFDRILDKLSDRPN